MWYTIAAGIGGERQLLAECRQPAQVPAERGERALRVLSFGAGQRERVDLRLDDAAQRAVGAAAVVDLGQRDRLHTLGIVEAQRLDVPAGDRQVTVVVNPLDLRRRAQPIIIGQVVTAQERLVGDETHRSRDAPLGRQLEPRDAIEIAPEALLSSRHAGDEVVAASADGGISGDAVRPDIAQLLERHLRHRQRCGVDMRRQRQRLVGREPKEIGHRDLKPVDPLDPQFGFQQPRARLAPDRVRQAGQRHGDEVEQMQLGAVIVHAALVGPIDHAHGGDLPRRILGATVRTRDVAGRVSGVGEHVGSVFVAHTLRRRDPSAARQHDQHVIDHAVLQRVGQVDRVAISCVALRVDGGDIAGCQHLARLAVPGHLVGA